MARLRSGNAPTPARPAASGNARSALREKTNTAATPAPAVETSMLALKNFKRRPRQGSMLEMVRKRRSSVQASLINAQPQADEDVEDTSVFDLGSASEGEGEDVFAPEAEGTPLQLSKIKNATSTRKSLSSAKKSVATTPAVKKTKRKSDELESSHSALDALRRKHRKSDIPPVEDELPSINDEQHLAANDASEHEASPEPNLVTSDVQVINSSPESTPPTEPSSTRKIPNTQEADFAVPSTEEQERLHEPQQEAPEEEEQEDEENEDDLDTPNATMAEPASSSPAASPIPETQNTDIYADPLTQLSPPPPEPAKTRSKAITKPAAMSTAMLRALLPRRTQRPQPRTKRTEYDISSDEDEDEEATAFDTTHLEDDEDELGGRTRRQTSKPSAKSRKVAAASTKAKPKTKQPLSTRKPPAPPPPAKSKAKAKAKAKAKGKAKATRTYGRAATTSDKENESSEDDDDDEGETTMSMREVAHSKELEEARRKFAEVDNWDLAFESMSNEDHRSSSQGWR